MAKCNVCGEKREDSMESCPACGDVAPVPTEIAGLSEVVAGLRRMARMTQRVNAAVWTVDQRLSDFPVGGEDSTAGLLRAVVLARLATQEGGAEDLVARVEAGLGKSLVHGTPTVDLKAAVDDLESWAAANISPNVLLNLTVALVRQATTAYGFADAFWLGPGEEEYAIAQVISTGEATLIWGLKGSTLRQAIRRKRLPAWRSGKVWLLRTGDIVRVYGAPQPAPDPDADSRYIFAGVSITLLGQVTGNPDRVVLQGDKGEVLVVARDLLWQIPPVV